MKNLYTYEDLQNPELQAQSLRDTEQFFDELEKEQDGNTNTGFSSMEDIISSITAPMEFTQAQANTFFSL
jgi:hypothetical protein